MSKFRVQIASVLDRENLIAEIWYEKELIAEINQEHARAEITLYFEKKIVVDYLEFVKTLEHAMSKLISMKPI